VDVDKGVEYPDHHDQNHHQSDIFENHRAIAFGKTVSGQLNRGGFVEPLSTGTKRKRVRKRGGNSHTRLRFVLVSNCCPSVAICQQRSN
jgi:hypothetical protein